MEPEQHQDPVVVAMERVLEAERATERRLEECREQADATMAAARNRAAAVVRRADARIARLHTAYLNKVNAEVAAVSARPTPGGRPGLLDEGELAAAVQRLAAELTEAT